MGVTVKTQTNSHPLWVPRSQASDRREWPRYPLGRDAVLELEADGRVFPCRLEDVSLGGARLSVADLPSLAGKSVVLSHPSSGQCPVTRSWRRGDELGVAFGFSPACLALIAHFVGREMAGQEAAPSAAE